MRAASLDLDRVYGFGLEASPHTYEGEHLAVAENGVDIARAPGGRALIGDPKKNYPLCYGLDAHSKVSMPVEFSAAAYPVGHTIVRDGRTLDAAHTGVQLFDDTFGTLGFSALPEVLTPEWRFLLALDPCVTPHMSKVFDPALAAEPTDLPVLGSRNGWETPLVYYLLRESELVSGDARYGPLGSALLLDVFGGMLRLCKDIIVEPLATGDWRPDPGIAGPAADFDKSRLLKEPDHYPLDLGDLIRFAKRLGPVG